MAIDMTHEPWSRLAKIAPPGTNGADLLAAATRYALTVDLFAAAADLWEEAGMRIDTAPDNVPEVSTEDRKVQSVTQDGISVTYSDEGLVGNSMSSRIAQQAQYMAKSRYYRKRAKASTPRIHDTRYNPSLGRGVEPDDDDRIIVVNGL